MSHEYYTTVNRSEYERLQREARNATSLAAQVAAEQRLQETLTRTNNEYRRRIDSMTSQINSSSRQINQLQTQNTQLRNEIVRTVNRQNQQLRELAEQQRTELEQMNRGFTQELGNVRREMQDTAQAINQTIRQQREELERRMYTMEEEIRGELHVMQDQIDTVEQSLQSMRDDEATLRDMARTYAGSVEAILQELQGHRAEQFVPGRMQELSDLLDTINGDLASNLQGIGGAARADARALLSQTLAFRQNVLLAEQRWELQRQIVLGAIDQVDAQIEASREITVGEETVDVEHWSHNALTSLRNRLNALREEADNRDLSIAQMTDLQAAVAELSEEVAETAGHAAVAFQASLDRYDIIAALESELFLGNNNGVLLQLDDDAYQGQDPRAGFRARFTNPQTGLEMAVTLVPRFGEDGQLSNVFAYDVESRGVHNEEFAAEILDNIVNILLRQGLLCNRPERLDEGDRRCNDADTRFNVEHWRQEPASIPEPPHRETQQARQHSGNGGQTRRNNAGHGAQAGS